MLEVKNLKKIYKSRSGSTVVALNGIDLKFPESGLIFILGKSGSGKSTLLNVISGLDGPDGGEIIIADKSSKNFTERDFDAYRNTYLGFIFQEYNILYEFSVRDNIALALELQNKPVTSEIIQNILKVVDLEEFADRKPNELSGGQKQRVAIARALVKEPNVIFADEPTGNLDSKSSTQIFDFIKKLSEKKLVIVVTHDYDNAEKYGDRIIELSDGKVISDVTHNKETEKKGKSRKHYFEPSKVVKVDKDVKFRPITANLPSKTYRKIALNNILNKKGRLIVTLILIVMALSLFGFAEILAGYNLVDATMSSFNKMKIENIRIEQGKIEMFDYFSRDRQVLEDKTIEKIKTKFPDITFNKYYPFLNMPIGAQNGARFMPTYVRGVVITDEIGLKEMGYELLGTFPEENTTEIVLTDFMIFNLLWSDVSRLGYGTPGDSDNILKFITEYNTEMIKKDSDLILSGEDLKLLLDILSGDFDKDTNIFTKDKTQASLKRLVTMVAMAGVDRPLTIRGGSFHITGVIQTGFERYLDIINKPFKEIVSDARVLDLQENVNYYYGNFYAAEGFLDVLNERTISLSNIILPSSQTYIDYNVEAIKDIEAYINKEKLNEEQKGGFEIFYFEERESDSLLKDEMLMSQDMFRNIFTIDYDIWKLSLSNQDTCPKYSFKYDVRNVNWESKVKEMKVVGIILNKRIIDENEAVVKIFKPAYPVIISDDFYLEISKEIQKVGALYFRLPGSYFQDKEIITYLCDTSPDGDLLYHLSPISELLYVMSDTLSIMQILFRYMSYALGLFSVVLLINFMTTSVMSKQTEIGVLRALGCRSRDVSKIFLFEAGLIGVVNLILTSLFMVLTTYGANMLFKNAFAKFFKNELVNSLSLLTLSLHPFILVSLISIVIIFFATIIPARKISKMKPVDAIKKT